jgi:hypothetical protein
MGYGLEIYMNDRCNEASEKPECIWTVCEPACHVLQVTRTHHVVAINDRAGFVPCDLHRDPFRRAQVDHVPKNSLAHEVQSSTVLTRSICAGSTYSPLPVKGRGTSK